MMGAVKKPTFSAKGKMRAAPAPATGPVDKWHDGRSIPHGFVLDPKPVVSDKWYALARFAKTMSDVKVCHARRSRWMDSQTHSRLGEGQKGGPGT